MEGHMPGEEGVWILILGDVVVFSLFFLTFLYYRGQQIPLFNASQLQLNRGCGALNTIFMLSSSWLVATGVEAARKGRPRAPSIFFLLASGCGIGFGVVKCIEYGEKIRAGITLNTNDFYMFYYMLTGIHFIHVLIGMVVLLLMTRLTWAEKHDDKAIRNLESGASFWHLVDLLWIVIFPLLYLVK
jgi:nitric oxide reductase NorE protein